MATTSTDRRYGVSSGLAFKAPCKAATTANITLSGEQTIDGVALVTGDRCLVKNQTNGVENGIYVVDTSAWELDRDWDGVRDVKKGTSVRVTDGTVNQGYWYVTTSDPITPGTTSVAFSRTVNSSEVPGVATITALKAINHAGLTANDKVTVVEAGRAGDFYWVTGDQSASVTADTQSGIWVAPDSAPTGASGAWKRVYSGALNVRWFGATGNGSTDDRTAIQAAIAACNSAGGGKVYFPRGTYLVSSSINLASVINVWLVGDGPNASTIFTTTNSISIISITGTSARCAVIGLWIGATSAMTAVAGIRVSGTDSSNVVYQLIVRDVTLQNINNPINIDYLHQSDFERVIIIQSIASAVSSVGIHLKTVVSTNLRDVMFIATVGTFGSDNVRVDKDCDTVTLQNFNISGGTTGSGIRFSNVSGTTGPRLTRAVNCYVEECTEAGFYVEAARDVRLYGCHAAVNDTHGFLISGGDSVTLSDCFSMQNDGHGVSVSGGTGVKIEGCTCSNNSQLTTATFDGINIGANVENVRVIGNRSGDFVVSSVNVQRYGLTLSTGTDYIVARGNDLSANGTGDIAYASSGANNNIEIESTYTVTLTGVNAAVTGTARYRREGRVVSLYIPALSGTSNTTACTLTGMPVVIRPQRDQEFPVLITDNGTNAFGWCSVSSAGVMTLYPSAALGAWTGSGTKGIIEQSVGWSLD